MNYEQKLNLVEMYGNAILEDDKLGVCLNCKHYDFEDDSQQICNNINNHQKLGNDWYKMTVTPDFGCNEWVSIC